MALPWSTLKYFNGISAPSYQGGWDASSGSAPSGTTAGYYYKVTTPGIYGGVSYSLDEYIGYDGVSWGKIPQTEFLNDITSNNEFIVTKFNETVFTPPSSWKFLCHFNGDDGTNSFFDRSVYGATLTPHGGAQCSTSQKRFGKSSLRLDGAGDYLTCSLVTNLSSLNFSISAWVQFSSTTGTQYIAAQEDGDGYRYCWALYYSDVDGLGFAYCTDTILTYAEKINRQWNPSTSVWYHVAVFRNGNSIHLSVDGTIIYTHDCTGDIIHNSIDKLVIGASADGGGSKFFNGWIDEVAIIQGSSLWSGNFAPSGQPYYIDIGYSYQELAFGNNSGDIVIRPYDNSISANAIKEITSGNGVDVDGVLCKDSQVSLNQINSLGDSILIPHKISLGVAANENWDVTGQLITTQNSGILSSIGRLQLYNNVVNAGAGGYKGLETGGCSLYMQEWGTHKFYVADVTTSGQTVGLHEILRITEDGFRTDAARSFELGGDLNVTDGTDTFVIFDRENKRFAVGSVTSAKFSVQADHTGYLSLINNTGTSTGDNGLYIATTDYSASGYALRVDTGAGANKVVIRNDGNVGIGIFNPSYQLHNFKSSGSIYTRTESASLAADEEVVNAAVGKKAGGAYRVSYVGVRYNPSSTSNETCGYMFLQPSYGGDDYVWVDDGDLLRISTNVAHIGTAYGIVIGDQTSDIRLKNVISNCEYGLAEILKLETKSFTFKNDSTNTLHVGFVAQQARDIIPESVYDTGEKVDNSAQTKLAMRYHEITPVLVNAVKEQYQLYQTHDVRIRQLEKRIRELEEAA